MGAETLLTNGEARVQLEAKVPVILGLQPAALIDHVARVDLSLLDQIPGERGGSIPVAIEELEHILSELKKHILASADDLSPMKTMAGGSVANTIRGLSSGLGVNCGMIGAFGDDEQGQLFVSNMSISGVNISRLRKKNGPTAQCVCLVDALGNRTMRPCLSTAVKVQADELTQEDFSGSKWLVLRYGIFNLEVIQAAIQFAKQEGVSVSLDLASFEIVRVPAIGEAKAVDATGAGDLFAGGFLYGLVKGLSLEECCKVGSCSGGSVIRSLGGEVTPENWQWMYKQMQVKGLSLPDIRN
ncbi:PfkB-like carbohydrate kinase family protein isoform 3 [Theobroma cacao]|uniref:PfkB-like carbohydrate kinase family protein isoform 3 n=1 Tax=Theobroma cacao TaxID=3641 RepID=A0A061FBU3_THECC|nr:PfkB-like carbohydrate kinase family protein isoform 3 [Theobroma cacao]